jgi:transitional endoplasmic reticulum ATPase
VAETEADLSSDRVQGLRTAVELSPENHPLRLILAETLAEEGEAEEALEHFEVLLDSDHLPADSLVSVGTLALGAGKLELASRLLKAAESAGIVEGVGELRRELNRSLDESGVVRLVRTGPVVDDSEWTPISEEQTITFADVGGLEEVKKAINRTIVLPFKRPDLYERYGRRSGGGILLFGPPGVGKTMLARATAGECGLPFLNVRIEEILDPYFGISERNLHEAFEQARALAPCVLFLDELDAIAYTRRKQQGSVGRPLVDQLLQELDSIGADNANLLVLAATNAPWDVDEGLKRPGRFDRMVFVSPPDQPARERILELHLEGKPGEGVDIARVASATALFSGADLRALVERSVDAVIDEALSSGGDPPLTTGHLERALDGMQPSTLEWLQTAKNYVEFANQGGRYDDVAAYLKSREAQAWRKK